MKTILRNTIHTNGKSHDIKVVELSGKKAKMTYQAYNANEKFDIHVFDGYDWKHFASINDLGVTSNSHTYIESDKARLTRAESLFKKGEDFCKAIL